MIVTATIVARLASMSTSLERIAAASMRNGEGTLAATRLALEWNMLKNSGTYAMTRGNMVIVQCADDDALAKALGVAEKLDKKSDAELMFAMRRVF